MKFWLLINNEKSGPFESFDIRDRINSGELKRSTLCWHSELNSWKPLEDLPLFENMFDQSDQSFEISEQPANKESLIQQRDESRKALSDQIIEAPPLFAWRRLFARIHDFLLYMVLIFVVFQDRVYEIAQGNSIFPLLAVGFSYVVLDALSIHKWKTSPGKILLGMKTTDALGHAIPLKFSVIRSLRVWILGLAMGIVEIWPLSLGISWFLSKKFGYFPWDAPKRYRVVAKPFTGIYIIFYVASLFAMSFILNISLPEEMLNEMRQENWMHDLLKDNN